MLTYLEATRFKMQCALADLDGHNKPTHPLFAHMEVKNKQVLLMFHEYFCSVEIAFP